MEFQKLITERYSVRKFDARPVEDEKIQAILYAGLVAPTAKNIQPQRVYVLKSEQAMEKINGLTPCIYGAPTAFLICFDREQAWHNPQRPGYDAGEMDASIVCTHMMLAAADIGLGSCWVGMFDDRAVRKAFDLPENICPAAILPVGYPAADAAPSERHESYLSEEETVTVL